MDTTFITIHDLSEDAHILYSSDSIVDILGHTPDEVVNRSCWDFFHPDEVPIARLRHGRGVQLDKAAVLSYCRIRNRQGDWVGCECCFSVVYDVLVCCTSIYRHGLNSQRRAVDAPLVRKLFSSSPKDPRYHMLSHLSNKFTVESDTQTHEPRAALFLNRFTRTLTIMYATSGIEQIIGIPSEEMIGRSFYFCIAQNCLQDAVNCLESAKGNDSIAYLRFHFRDPRQDDASEPSYSESEDASMTDVTSEEDDDDSVVGVDASRGHALDDRQRTDSNQSNGLDGVHHGSRSNSLAHSNSGPHVSHGNSADRSSSASYSIGSPFSEAHRDPVELEAVVSCTSDGLVVCLRRARPMVPNVRLPGARSSQYSGMFAAPWASEPVYLPPMPCQPQYPHGTHHPATAQAQRPTAVQNAFMNSIRDVAVFAWALVGINGNLSEYSRGKAVGESQPPNGLSVWNPSPDKYSAPTWRPSSVDKSSATPSAPPSAPPSGYVSGSGSASSNDPYGFGDPGLR